jgi:hypothetical protein
MCRNADVHPAGPYPLERSGRWQAPYTGSLVASWCGASVRFLYTGRSLSIRAELGLSRTERKDRFNGGTPMIACVVSEDTQDDVVGLYDMEASQTIQLFSANPETEEETVHQGCLS